MKLKAKNLEDLEIDKFNKERNEKIKIRADQLEHRHHLEKSALKQKLDGEYETLKKMKEDEAQKLIQKFKIRKRELELQQKQEKNLQENYNLANASK